MSKSRIIVFALLCVFIAPLPLSAGEFDGSKPLLCAVIETFECGPGDDCQRGTAQSINIPLFVRVNFTEKTISGTRPDGEMRTTDIQNMDRIDGRLILQGVQNGKAWSMIIMESTGMMTVTASDVQAGFVVFGACTPR